MTSEKISLISFLTNNGYKVINLGIKCPVETMIHAVEQHKADAIGMSGLLVKSTLIMKENLEVLNEQNLTIPVILGGAALTRRYVEQDLEIGVQRKSLLCQRCIRWLEIDGADKERRKEAKRDRTGARREEMRRRISRIRSKDCAHAYGRGEDTETFKNQKPTSKFPSRHSGVQRLWKTFAG